MDSGRGEQIGAAGDAGRRFQVRSTSAAWSMAPLAVCSGSFIGTPTARTRTPLTFSWLDFVSAYLA